MNAHKWQWKRNTISQRTYRHFIKCLPENPNGVESPDRVLVPECEQCKVSLRVASLIYLCRISYGTCKNRQTEYLISNWNKINLHAIVIVNYFQYPVSFSMPCIFSLHFREFVTQTKNWHTRVFRFNSVVNFCKNLSLLAF